MNSGRRARNLLYCKLELQRGPNGWRVSAVGLPAMIAAVLICLALILGVPAS